MIVDDVWFKAWEVSARTNHNWVEIVVEGIELFGPDMFVG